MALCLCPVCNLDSPVCSLWDLEHATECLHAAVSAPATREGRALVGRVVGRTEVCHESDEHGLFLQAVPS